tara:strand:+ start:21621 stop:24683 length:3063 start_codon:yes stop_codon:yes gene_type:complete
MSILSDRGRRVFALEVGGLIYRYHSGAGCAGLNTLAVSGVDFVDVEGISAVSAFSASIDPSGGIGIYEPVTVTLNINKKASASDAGVIFGRCGARSAGTVARITDNVRRTDGTISVDTDLTHLSYPRIMHIGGESVKVSSATSTVLTVTAGRGVANTPTQSHSIDLEGVTVPKVTDEITTFRGRRVKLYCAHQYPDQTLSAWVEVINGFIESTPAIEQGDSVSLSIVPMVALIDNIVTDKGINQSKLLHNYHYYGNRGNVLEYAMQLKPDQGMLKYDIQHSAGVTASTFNVFTISQALELHYDVSRPTGLDSNDELLLPVPHPRYPFMRIMGGANAPVYPTAISSSNVAGRDVYIINANAFANSATVSMLQSNASVNVHSPVEIKQHTISGLQKWPQIINETLETDGPSTVTGISGGVLKWRLTEDSKIRTSKLTAGNAYSNTAANLYLWTHAEAFTNNAPPVWSEARAFLDDNQTSLNAGSMYRVWYGIDLGTGDEPAFEDYRGTANRESGQFKTIEISAGQTSNTQQLKSIALAYYQIFEDRILVESSLGLPTTATTDLFDIVVRYYDRNSQSMREQVFKATHESTATYNSVNVGYYIHINRSFLSECISFGDWPDGERALISRGGRFKNERIGTALLQLLSSGGGGSVNSIYDVFSVGCNLKLEHIDEDTFLSIDSASPFTVSGQFAGVGADVRKMINSLLRLIGAVMIMKRSETGASQIALVPIGAERAANADTVISADDWLTDPPPHWDALDDIVTQIKYEYDYDVETDEYQSEVFFNNQEAVSRYGGEQSKITLSLAGISSEQFGRGAGNVYAEFLPTSARIFNLLSNPLRVWRGSIGSGHSALLDLGSYVKCSSPHLRGYSDSYGVTDGIGMVRSIRQELMSEGCDLELITSGLAPVAWNSSATVATVPDTTSVTVNTDDFSNSSIDDVSFFSVGDVVDYVPNGAQDTAITGLTIDSISSNTITFTGAHGISLAGGTLEPTTYANASNTHKADAYLADNSDLLNSTDAAQEYS